jgi:tetratricopeptide (TPR) repeat protein
VVVQARDAVGCGATAEAFTLLRREISTNRENGAAILAFWDAAIALDRPRAAAPAMLRLLNKCVERGEMNLAVEYWNRVTKLLPDELAEPSALVRLAPALSLLRQPDRAVEALRHAIHPRNVGLSAKLALQALRAAKELDPALAIEVARRTLELPDVSAIDRPHLRELAGETDEEPQKVDLDPPSSTLVSRFSAVKALEGVPERLGERSLLLRVSGDRAVELPYDEVQALAAAAIRNLAEQPVVVVDLVLNWSELTEGPLRLVRMRSDAFDPRGLVPETGSVERSYRKWLDALLELTQAAPLPDLDHVGGEPLAVFDDLRSYERDVLGVES